MKTSHIAVGVLGEAIAVKYLRGKGYTIVSTNWNCHGVGEIDIIATCDEVLHFIEVKSVTRENFTEKTTRNPLENVTDAKLRCLRKCAEVYLMSHRSISRVTFSAVSVVLDMENVTAQCVLYADIPLG